MIPDAKCEKIKLNRLHLSFSMKKIPNQINSNGQEKLELQKKT